MSEIKIKVNTDEAESKIKHLTESAKLLQASFDAMVNSINEAIKGMENCKVAMEKLKDLSEHEK